MSLVGIYPGRASDIWKYSMYMYCKLIQKYAKSSLDGKAL